MKKKSKAGIAILCVLLVLLAAAAIVTVTVIMPRWEQMKADYAQAQACQEAGDYRQARTLFLRAGKYQDAQEQAAQLEQAMQETAAAHKEKAQALADRGFGMIAGLYLTEILEDETRYLLEDYNDLAALVSEFYEQAHAKYEEVSLRDDKKKRLEMDPLMDRIIALEESNDPVEALAILNELTTAVLAEQLVADCMARDTLTDISLSQMAEAAPFWVPLLDMHLAGQEDLDVLELIERG